VLLPCKRNKKQVAEVDENLNRDDWAFLHPARAGRDRVQEHAVPDHGAAAGRHHSQLHKYSQVAQGEPPGVRHRPDLQDGRPAAGRRRRRTAPLPRRQRPHRGDPGEVASPRQESLPGRRPCRDLCGCALRDGPGAGAGVGGGGPDRAGHEV